MPRATLRQAAVLVGGLGTRLGSLTRSTPKPLLPVGDRPFLAWLLRELARFGVEEAVLLTGHLSQQVRAQVDTIAAGLPRPMRIICSDEPIPAGTGGALHFARHLLDERFLLCNGDSWFDCNLATALADGSADRPEVVGRMIVRRVEDAGRYGVVQLHGDAVAGFAERGPAGEAGDINTGIYLLDRRILDAVAPKCSLERDVLPRLAAQGALRATRKAGYFIDIGIPDDYARAQTGIPHVLHRRALFLDRDGTLNVDHGWVGDQARFDWIQGAREAVAAASAAGWHVFVVTNQAGVARGLYDEAAVQRLHGWMADELRAAGGTLDDIRYCPFHPDFGPVPPDRADWRKPGAGMIRDLLARWGVDPACCVLVGDRASDLQAAAAAGVAGHLFTGGDLAAFIRPLLAA